jgi:hypothetical protein
MRIGWLVNENHFERAMVGDGLSFCLHKEFYLSDSDHPQLPKDCSANVPLVRMVGDGLSFCLHKEIYLNGSDHPQLSQDCSANVPLVRMVGDGLSFCLHKEIYLNGSDHPQLSQDCSANALGRDGWRWFEFLFTQRNLS